MLRRGRTAYDVADRDQRERYLARVAREADPDAGRDPGGAAGEREHRLAATASVIAQRVVVDDLGTHAGALTYAALLSIPPLLVFSASITAFALVGRPGAQKAVTDALGQLLPSDLAGSATAFLSKEMSTVISGRLSFGLVGLAGLLWSASGFASRLRHALGRIFGTERTGLLTGRVAGMVIGALMVLAIVGLAVLSGLEAWLGSFGSGDIVVRGVALVGLAAGEFVFVLALFAILTPGKGPRLRDHLPGTILFVVGWEAVKGLGGFFFARVIATSTVVYGALGALFGIAAFLYATMWLLLLGAEVSAHRWRRDLESAQPGVVTDAPRIPPSAPETQPEDA